MERVEQSNPNLLLEEMVPPAVLHRILTSFRRVTGLKVVLVDRKGHIQFTQQSPQLFCNFCQEIRSTPLGLKRCEESYARAGAEAVKYGEPYIFRCHAGLVALAAPITVAERNLASIICSQVLMWEPEDYFYEEIDEMTKPLGLKSTNLMELAHQLPVIPADKVQAAADMLFAIANHIMQTNYVSLMQKREISAQQARLSEEIRVRKKLEETINTLKIRVQQPYSLQKEQELASALRKGDKAQAFKLLDDLLSSIVQRFSGDTKGIKARITEIMVVMSRAAIEGGASLRELLSINSTFMEELTQLDSSEYMYSWLAKVMEQFLNSVMKAKDEKYQNIISKSVEFIRSNYSSRITVDDIARAVYISPSYLSRVFRKEFGCTVLEFLTKARVEESKKLLVKPEYTVSRVALETGFEDSSYFSKVFRRVEGISPSNYRQKAQ